MAQHVAVYVRVSTIGQNETGQRLEIERWLEGNHFAPTSVRWYIDKESGDTLDRPEFARLQADVFAGQIGTVVIWRLDRLSRKLRDGLNVLCDWCDRKLRVVSVSQQIDFNGTMGKMLAAVLLGIAEMEQESRRERQRIGIDAAKATGVYTGRRAGTTKAKPARARDLRAKGNSVAEIAAALKISRRTAFRYLDRVFS